MLLITKPYLLLIRIPFTRNHAGRLFCDLLWAKDLKLHLNYLADFSICCPVVYSEDVHKLVDITDYPIRSIHELKMDVGIVSVIRNLAPNFFRVAYACKRAAIVHSSGAGWAFPLSFYVLIIKYFTKFQWVMVIESSFWMRGNNEKAGLRSMIRHQVYKILLTACVKSADARIFTQSFYRHFFLGEDTQRTLIAPAIWVEEENILSPDAFERRHAHRKAAVLECIYPARLIEDKGVLVLFAAIRLLQAAGVQVRISIMGTGALEKMCRDFAQQDFGSVAVVFIEPVEYGPAFFAVLSQYDVVLVPNMKEEQPRIIFDAFSQGCCVIASNTSGIVDMTIDGENVIIFERGNSKSLANAIQSIANQPELIRAIGFHALNYIRGKSHQQMHRERERFLTDVLDV